MRGRTRIKLGAKRFLSCLLLVVLLATLTGCQGGVFPGLEGIAPIYPVTPEPTKTPFAHTPTAIGPTATLSPRATPQPSLTPTPEISSTPAPPILYYTQAGDTLRALGIRFGVDPTEITSPDLIPTDSLFNPGQLLVIPSRLGQVSAGDRLIPDSEIVYSPSALDFEIKTFVNESGGYLKDYQKWFLDGWNDGAKIIQRVTLENSVNPRLLLAILEYQAQWVYGQPEDQTQIDYPIGYQSLEDKELYNQLSWAVSQLNLGYYGWREGLVTELTFRDGEVLRLAPELNAGTVAVLYLFAQLYDRVGWEEAIYGENSLPALYQTMFGDPWLRAQSVEPLFPATLTQPFMELPFRAGKVWGHTGGPHSAWGPGGARAALDFAPGAVERGCVPSSEWVTAVADGLVVRSETGLIVVDLDGDGYEQTGWAILYLHIATVNKVPLGTWVMQNENIGHPSCEGGRATGTHVHIARKYNGEWILADGPLAFELSGWRSYAGEKDYQGGMIRGDEQVIASFYSEYTAAISR